MGIRASVVLQREPGEDRLARINQVLLRVHGGMLLTFALVSIGPMFESGTLPLAQWAPRAIVVFAYVLVACDLQLRGERPAHLAVLLVPLLAVASAEAVPISNDVASGLSVGALALSAARQLRPLPYLGFMVLAGIAHSAVRWLAGGSVDEALADVVVGIGMTFAVHAFAAALERAAKRSVEADAKTSRQRQAAAREEAQRRAVAAAGQALHDEVLVALRTVGDGSVSRERTRRVCEKAVEAVAELETLVPRAGTFEEGPDVTGGRSVRDLTRAIATEPHFKLVVSLDPAAAGVALPSPVHEAVERAVREALRNVLRHSGAVTADLRVSLDDNALRVWVVDRGSGLPEPFEAGYGTLLSIVDAVGDVGGSAELKPTPGGGTTVDLRVPLQPPANPSALRSAYNRTIRATGTASPIHAITWPVALVWVYTAIRYSWEWPTPWVSLLLVVLYVGTTAVVVLRITQRSPTVRWLMGAATGLLALDALSLALAPPGSLLDYRSWTFGFLAAPLVALTMVLPWPAAVTVLAPHPVLIVISAYLDPALTGGAVPWGSLNAVVGTPVAAMVLGRLLRGLGRRIEVEESESAGLSAERARRRSLAAVRTLHLEHTTQVVVPWLTAISTGEIDSKSAEAAKWAGLLSSEVRDDLYAPGFLQGDMRRKVTAFRHGGGQLTLRPGLQPGALDNAAQDVLRYLLDVLEPRHRITVAPQGGFTGQPDGVRFAVVPSAHSASWSGLAHCTIETDEFLTIITLPTSQLIESPAK